MNYSMLCLLALASLTPEPHATPMVESFDAVLDSLPPRLRKLVADFQSQPVTPTRAAEFERTLQSLLRDIGRDIVQWAYNASEPAAVDTLAKHLTFQGEFFTRLNRKTPQPVWTLFGSFTLHRVGYRSTEKNGTPTIFPAALALGLVEGVSPALAERVGWFIGSAGTSQQRVLDQLKRDYAVGWGVEKLRAVGAALAVDARAFRQEVQVEKLLEYLTLAEQSRGRHKPVLSVGRDGVSVGMRYVGVCLSEVASTATVSVMDRRGKRVGTVYLAYMPESGQPTMSRELTALLEEVLKKWTLPLPRLAYVTDSGDNEVAYYENGLAKMVHPRTGEPLAWIRVADYYHASQRVWTMAEALFGKGRIATNWARTMLKWMLTPGGVNRVLHSAAAHRTRIDLGATATAALAKASRYLRDRMPYMHYAAYRRLGVPCGSGVTEAACKTVYAQRLKLSGMRWKSSGAQTVLDLRVLQLSGVWTTMTERVLSKREQPKPWGQKSGASNETAIAA